MNKQKNHRGYFITVEGIEGVGKSTAVQFLANYLQQQQLNFMVTREPGGTPIAEAIRQVLLSHHQEKMTANTELLLMFASRAQHITNLIKPALVAGKIVLSDRFCDASYAYQGGGRGIATDFINALEKQVLGELQPNLTILLDAPVTVGLQRAKQRSAADRIEAEKQHFFERVREAYLIRAAQFKERFQVINAQLPIAQVQQQLIGLLRTHLALL